MRLYSTNIISGWRGMVMSLRLIGDTHGKVDRYLALCREADYNEIPTLQIGDFGWATHWAYIYKKGLDHKRHKFFGGNHDDYEIYNENKYSIGDYGYYVHGNIDLFFVRGGFSIDHRFRTPGKDLFREEELNYTQLMSAVESYADIKPDIVITHEAPRSIAKLIGNPLFLRDWGYDPDRFTTRTSEALERMLEIHKPKFWYFGHFHLTWKSIIDGVHFQCLNELEYVDITSNNA